MPVATRLTNAGVLLATGSFDEITYSSIKVSSTDVYAAQFDEVSLAAGSISFNGTSQYLTSPNITFNSNDFTIESWIYPILKVAFYPCLFCNFTGVNSYLNAGGLQLDLDHNNAPGKYSIIVNGTNINLTTPVVYGSWAHVAFTRNGNTFNFWYNGVNVYSQSVAGMTFNGTGSTWYIGAAGDNISNSYLNTRVSNFRIVTGTALYTTDFTPPTGILPAITNTSLLLNVTDSDNFIKDNGPNKFTVTNNNSATFNANGPFNQGTTGLVQRQANDGTYMVSGYFNETGILSYNPNLWFSPAITFAGVADTTVASSLPNLGLSGSIYNASTSTGAPQVATQNGVKVLNFNGSTLANLQLATEIDLSTNSSVFFVGYQTANRMVALGGSNASGNGNAFFGWSGSNNTVFLFRNSSDGGQTLTGLQSVAGLKVFGMIQGTSTFIYYDNSTTPTNGTYVSGTYKFGKVGARDYGGSFNSQLSTGYLGDIVAFNRAVSNDEAVMIIALLKEKYNIS
jgi:hypothetical protein